MDFISVILAVVLVILAFKKSMIWGIIAIVLAAAYLGYVFYPKWLIIQGQKAFNEGDLKKAKEYGAKSFSRMSFKQKMSYAYMLVKMGDVDQGLEILDSFIRMQALDEEQRCIAKRQRCFAYYKQARYEEALKDALDVKAAGYMTNNIYGIMGMIMLILNKDEEETTKLCNEAYDYDEDDRDIQDNVSICYYLKGDYDYAAEVNGYVREENPEFLEGYYHGAQIAVMQKKYKDAKKLLEKIPECKRTEMTTVSEEAVEALKNEVNDLISGKLKEPFETPVFTMPEPVAPPADFTPNDDDDEESEGVSIYDEYNKLEHDDDEEGGSIYDELNALEGGNVTGHASEEAEDKE